MQKHRKTYCNFRIASVTCTAEQIQHNRNRKLTGNEAGLVAYLDFDEASGQVAVDRSGNNNHGYFGSTFMTETSDPQRSQSAAVLASYSAELVSATDYYPDACPERSRRSMEMPERGFSSNAYRYGFNGMEKDDEIKGSGNSYDFGARIYDSRIGRWLSVDPVFKPNSSPYVYASNNPIIRIAPKGDDDFYIEHGVLLYSTASGDKPLIAKQSDYDVFNAPNNIGLTIPSATPDGQSSFINDFLPGARLSNNLELNALEVNGTKDKPTTTN